MAAPSTPRLPWRRCFPTRSLAISILLGVGLSAPALAQVAPFLVKDINTDDPAVSSSPLELVTIGDTTFFSASTLATGRELWKTDGTEAGTVPVLDLWPGPTDSWPHGLTEIDGELYFAARSPGRGLGFWKSDGTPDGTEPVGEAFPGKWALRDGVLLEEGSILLLRDAAARDGEQLMDLWFANESEADYVPLPYQFFSIDGEIESLVTTGTQAFFNASYKNRSWSSTGRPTRAPQVAVTDGTGEGTRQVTEFVSLEAKIRGLTASGSRAFFVVDRVDRSELWTSDGTAEGTSRLLKKKAPKRLGSLVSMGGVLYFQLLAKDGWRLWRSNGTRDGTEPVEDVEFGGDARSRQLVVWEDRLYFDLERPGKGTVLWRSDGTADGTGRVRKLAGPGKLAVVSMKAVGPWLTFVVRSREPKQDDRHQLWVSDGERSGTVPVADGSGAIPDHRLAVLGDQLLFVPDDPESREEIWVSDGTEGDARQLAQPVVGAPSSDPGALTSHGGWLYFTANDGRRGRELWRSDGTEQGTQPVADVWPGIEGSEPRYLTSAGDLLYFTAAQKGLENRELWRSDGTAEGTRPVRAKGRKTGFEMPQYGAHLAAFGSLAFFGPMTDSRHGSRLWVSDGTRSGTGKLGKLRVKVLPHARVFRDRLCFTANEGVLGDELWCSDGSRSGTEQVEDIAPGSEGSFPWEPIVAGDQLYFAARTPLEGKELWASDGTPSGTRMIDDLAPGDESSNPRNFLAFGEQLLFTWTSKEEASAELWITDETEAGTRPLRSFSLGYDPFALLSVPGLAFFSGRTEEHGRELWVSDGTPDGTRMVQDLWPGPRSGNPHSPIVVGDRLIFRAGSPSGPQIFISDGTPEGTHPIIDFTPDFQLRSMQSSGRVGDLIFFVAETDESGRELWAFSVDDLL